ncbi:MAG: biosynthetic arginine decarboxylase [Phycisphaeraceae bacterium]|nr:biosynthetic arginine decarboxylase [Phycisphaeraceae bacterium]
MTQSLSLSAAPDSWSLADAAEFYGVEQWGAGYVAINEAGNVEIRPDANPQRAIDLKALVEELMQRDIQPPLLIRFTDILRHRLASIADAFTAAIREFDYQGRYQAVYPIKVNQQRHVVEEVLGFGRQHGFGLEAGSKPELLALMALVDDDQTPIICNGFKDDQFIEAVILATKLGRNIIPVVEKFSELKLIVKYAQRHEVRPRIGIRVKLAARGAGRWESSGGHRSKFGLFVSEVIEAVDFLRDHDMLDCLQLLHSHLGSQINRIRTVKTAVNELARVYAEVKRAGAGLNYVDVGGGLGVDYDGSHIEAPAGINYTLREYANDIVYHLKEVCDDAQIPHPTIISESGRAMVAYHSVLIFNVLGWSGFDRFELPDDLSKQELKKMPKPVRNLYESYHDLNERNWAEYYHDCTLNRDEVLHLFNLGYCSLEQRGLAERLYFGICSKVLRYVRELEETPQEFADLESMLSDTYFCNCSIFQSLPDHWAIDQLFPIMPIHRLQERPTCRGILADVTCDSDGKIDLFISPTDSRPAKAVLELHPYTGADYFLGAFLVGAYQETLGDLHNLFGDTNAIHVSLDESGKPTVDEVVEGDTVSEVLGYVQFEPEQLRRTFRRFIEQAVRDRKLTLDEASALRKFYENGLAGYTYLT